MTVSAPVHSLWRACLALAVSIVVGVLSSCDKQTQYGDEPFAGETIDQLFGLGSYLDENGDIATATAVYERIAKDDRATVDILEHVAKRLEAADALAPAAQAYERIVQIEPDNSEAFASLGRLQIRLGRLEEGIEAFEQWVTLDDEATDAYMKLAASLDFAGRHKEAEKIYLAGLEEIGEENPDLSLNYALSLALAGRFSQAIDRANRTLENTEVDRRHLRNTVLILALAGKPDIAKKRGVPLGPFETDLILNQANRLNELETSAARARSLGGVTVAR